MTTIILSLLSFGMALFAWLANQDARAAEHDNDRLRFASMDANARSLRAEARLAALRRRMDRRDTIAISLHAETDEAAAESLWEITRPEPIA